MGERRDQGFTPANNVGKLREGREGIIGKAEDRREVWVCGDGTYSEIRESRGKGIACSVRTVALVWTNKSTLRLNQSSVKLPTVRFVCDHYITRPPAGLAHEFSFLCTWMAPDGQAGRQWALSQAVAGWPTDSSPVDWTAAPCSPDQARPLPTPTPTHPTWLGGRLTNATTTTTADHYRHLSLALRPSSTEGRYTHPT